MLYWSTERACVIFFNVSAVPTALASAATPSCVSVVSVGGGNSIRIICCVHNFFSLVNAEKRANAKRIGSASGARNAVVEDKGEIRSGNNVPQPPVIVVANTARLVLE